MIVRYRTLRPYAKAPEYKSAWASGLDLFAAGELPTTLEPGQRGLCATGIALEIPPGYEGQIRPRSGLASKHGLTVLNAPGTIDADYRGEICVLLINLGDYPVEVAPGDRVAQIVIAPVQHVQLEQVDDLSPSTRGAGGFGSTGR
jgi:dUTP pyrophosphatase